LNTFFSCRAVSLHARTHVIDVGQQQHGAAGGIPRVTLAVVGVRGLAPRASRCIAAGQDRTANESSKGDEQIINSKRQSRQRHDKWHRLRPRARLWVVLVQHHHDLLTRNGHWAGLCSTRRHGEGCAACVRNCAVLRQQFHLPHRENQRGTVAQTSHSKQGRNDEAVGARPEGTMKHRAIGPWLMSPVGTFTC
jgi:hypothetical protein